MYNQQKMEESTTSTLTMKSTKSQKEFRTIPILGNLQESICMMTNQQIALNIIEINLVSLYNEEILNKLYEWSLDTEFYLRNRYILENLIPHQQNNNKNKNHPSMKYKKGIKEISEKYDAVYVNGSGIKKSEKESHIIKEGLKKQQRARFISQREEFVAALEDLSHTLKENEQKFEEQEDEMRKYFIGELQKLNEGELSQSNSISPNKLELLKSTSSISISSNESIQDLTESPLKSSQKKQKQVNNSIFTLSFGKQVKKIKKINIVSSSYIKTKNRYPLVLDFGFAKFIYKNDNQLAHQIIAMSMIKYINKIISSDYSPQIIEYQIIPQAFGAFYEFVDNSMTVSKIKAKYDGGIVEYLNELEAQNLQDSKIKMSKIRRRFAQTYAGFCIAQYLLQLKDRNNDNIMIRRDGSIFHIDLAFIYNATPGGIGFESCPFKFTKQYLQAMGGFESDTFKYFETLMTSNFTKLCLNKDELFSKMTIISARTEIPCFLKFNLHTYKKKIPANPSKVKEKVEELIDASFDNWRTKKYDTYQFNTNGILP